METFLGREILRVSDLREGDHLRLAYEGTIQERAHLGDVKMFHSEFHGDNCLVFDHRGTLEYAKSSAHCVRATFDEILESQGIEIKPLKEIPRGADVNILELDFDSPVPGTHKILGSYYVFRRESATDILCRDNEDELRMVFFRDDIPCYQTSPIEKPVDSISIPIPRPLLSERSIMLE